jgi:hypothetical protein
MATAITHSPQISDFLTACVLAGTLFCVSSVSGSRLRESPPFVVMWLSWHGEGSRAHLMPSFQRHLPGSYTSHIPLALASAMGMPPVAGALWPRMCLEGAPEHQWAALAMTAFGKLRSLCNQWCTSNMPIVIRWERSNNYLGRNWGTRWWGLKSDSSLSIFYSFFAFPQSQGHLPL